MVRFCLALLLIGCADAPEPLPPPPVRSPVAAPIAARPPEIIDLSNDVVIVQVDCDDPAMHCRDDDDDDDRDRDSIPDTRDKCPDEPEDIDGFQDSDGCPDPDVDHEAAPDVEDRCPDVPDGNGDLDGCPEPVT